MILNSYLGSQPSRGLVFAIKKKVRCEGKRVAGCGVDVGQSTVRNTFVPFSRNEKSAVP